MLDIGWSELILIGIVALIVVGPKELPALFRTVGNFTGKARGMAREFQRSLEQAANESGMGEVSKSLRSIDQGLNAATDSARRFARAPMRTLGEEAVSRVGEPAAAEPPAAGPPAAEPPAAEAAAGPAAAPDAPAAPETRERAGGR